MTSRTHTAGAALLWSSSRRTDSASTRDAGKGCSIITVSVAQSLSRDVYLAPIGLRMERVADWFKPLTVFSDWKEDLYTASDSETEDAATGANMDVDNKSNDEKDDRPPHLIPHRVLASIEFRDRPWGGYYGVREDAQLRPLTEADEAYSGSALLHDHLLVQRSFATDIPVDGICVGEMGGHEFRRENVKRHTGVTVLDVVTTIHAEYVCHHRR